jgi:hypothetical protein
LKQAKEVLVNGRVLTSKPAVVPMGNDTIYIAMESSSFVTGMANY